MLEFDRKICTDFIAASSREWLETNGIGGFSSGTISGANIRRYHGLLTAAIRPPLGRLTILSKFEETAIIDGVRYELSSNQYPGAIHPQGYRYLQKFLLDPFPVWHFDVRGIQIEKKVFMVSGKNAVICRWKVKIAGNAERERLPGDPDLSGRSVRLELRPLISFVDYHQLQHENRELNGQIEAGGGYVRMRPYEGLPEIFFAHNGGLIEKTGDWYHNFEYEIERERGFDHHEDLFQPFRMEFDLLKGADVIASTEPFNAAVAAMLESEELERRASVIEKAGSEDRFTQQLVLAADQFIVKRGAGETVIAGYPWFSDWGRDTMIALPGLTLSTNRTETARSILIEFSRHISEGMLPNRFPDGDEPPEYNTVDATLWYFEAVRAYAEKTGDHALIRDELYEKLAEILAWHVRGTRYNIHADTDGLLFAGEPGVQLTWMDAKVGDTVITPRTGKPVEIEALWYNALRIMADMANRFGHEEDEARFLAMANLARLSFNGLFWNEAEQCLFDVVENGFRDAAVRPNQIFAVSLFYPVLDEGRWASVVEKVEKELLTPCGLRSLSRGNSSYVPHYAGSPFERDSAYHQGTVWAWLIGPFVDAYRRVHAGDNDVEAKIDGFLSGFRSHLCEAGIGQISEIFDAEPPHAPRGCFAQAWSVAEVLRVLQKTQV